MEYFHEPRTGFGFTNFAFTKPNVRKIRPRVSLRKYRKTNVHFLWAVRLKLNKKNNIYIYIYTFASHRAYLFEREAKLSLDNYDKTRDKRFLKASSSFAGSLVVVYMSTSSLHLHSSSFESPKSVPPLLTCFGPVSSAVSSPSAVTVTNRPIARRSTPPSFFRRDGRFPFAHRNPYRQCRTLLKVANFY